MRRLWEIIGIMSLFNALDLLMTYYAMPDLYNEANYYVEKYDFRWPGLIFVLVTWQIIDTIPVIYRHRFFKPVQYNFQEKKTFFRTVLFYFFGTFKFSVLKKINLKTTKHTIKSIVNFLGFYLPVWFCMMKLIVILENAAFGIIGHNAYEVIKKDGWTTMKIGDDSFLLNTYFGRLILSFHEFNTNSDYKSAIYEIIHLLLLVIVFYIFFYNEYKRAKVSDRINFKLCEN